MTPVFLQGCQEESWSWTPGIVSIMVNEEDHLRIQVLLGRMALSEAHRIASAIDRSLYGLGFAFDPEFGFLTTCPTNVGTALRASVMLHLPALKLSRAMPELIAQSGRLGLVVRGAYGEGTASAGALYQVSNQVTLGLSPDELSEKVETVSVRLAEQEARARELLLDGNQGSRTDLASWGALSMPGGCGFQSYGMPFPRSGTGSRMGSPPKRCMGTFFLEVQAAHVQARAGGRLREEDIELRVRDWSGTRFPV